MCARCAVILGWVDRRETRFTTGNLNGPLRDDRMPASPNETVRPGWGNYMSKDNTPLFCRWCSGRNMVLTKGFIVVCVECDRVNTDQVGTGYVNQ